MKLLIVGNEGGTNIGPSLRRAAQQLGHQVRYHDIAAAFAGPALLRRASWHLLGRRPPRLNAFSADVVSVAREFQPDLLLATGTAPLTQAALQQLRAQGVVSANYLTDDPWNRTLRGAWLLASIAGYDHVFSPRRSNLHDLKVLGVRAVHYLPFAYDAELFFRDQAQDQQQYDVIFAAAADADRVPYVHALLQRGYRVGLFGVYWDRFRETRGRSGDWLEPARLRPAVAAARLALCLVRRANRDGHVMRTYELPAMHSCILAEDTAEQRDILGDTAVYFNGPADLVAQADALLARPDERARLASCAHARITGGANTYRDRLQTILQTIGH